VGPGRTQHSPGRTGVARLFAVPHPKVNGDERAATRALTRLAPPGPRGRRLIQLQGVRYAIGERVLFDGVDWVIGPGDRCALVGPNGAGKTTLIRLILGEITP